MGQYLIPSAKSVKAAAAYLPFAPNRRWSLRENGVLFEDDNLNDQGCANLYAGFIPLESQTDDNFEWPTPEEVKAAVARLKVTATTNATVRDVLILLKFLNSKID